MTDDSSVDSLVDREQLENFLTETLGEVDQFDIERHEEGHSNETLFVTWGNRELVLRRPPAGETAESAHDVLREYRILSALESTSLPVPEPLIKCEDHGVIGSEFYVMERLDGRVIRSDEPTDLASRDNRRTLGYEVADVLADLHTVDYQAIGLEDLGNPEGYTERQVERWRGQLDWASSITDRELASLYTAAEWLQEHIPDSHEHSLVHGDYRLDNLMISHETPPDIIGVLDWEVSTLGDPLMDLGWLLLDWTDPGDEDPIIPEWTSPFTRKDGYPTREQLITRYEKAAGIQFDNRDFYRTFARFKMATAGEMVYARYIRGNIDGDLPPQMEERVPKMAERTRDIITK